MSSEDEHIVSEIFDILNSDDTQIFAIDDDDPAKSSLSLNNLCNNYLREHISEPLSYALAYVILYRPEDPIEFIAGFLINWSRKTMIDQELNSLSTQSFINTQQNKDIEQDIIFEKEKNLMISSQNNIYNKPHIDGDDDDDEQVSSNHFQEEKQSTHRINPLQYIHTHDTASGLDGDSSDEMKSNQENNRNHICQDSNLSSFTYFSKLRDKIIKCDDF